MSLNTLFERTQTLPTMPVVVMELLAAFNDPGFDIPAAVKLLKRDQVLSARLLKLANSTRYSRGKALHSIDEAAIRLGLNPMKSLVVSCGLNRAFPRIAGVDQQTFWLHTHRVAEICRILAQSCRSRTDTAYTCGILHNIGEMLIYSIMPEEAGLIELAIKEGESKLKVQRQMLGFDFIQAGTELARRWKLDPMFINAIAFQQDPLGQQPFSPEAAMIRIATYINVAYNKGLPLATILTYLPKPLMEQCRIDRNQLHDALPQYFELEQADQA